jgi:hypothetical protein
MRRIVGRHDCEGMTPRVMKDLALGGQEHVEDVEVDVIG